MLSGLNNTYDCGRSDEINPYDYPVSHKLRQYGHTGIHAIPSIISPSRSLPGTQVGWVIFNSTWSQLHLVV